MMNHSLENRILHRAVEKGLLTLTELEQLEIAHETDETMDGSLGGGSRLDQLLRTGQLRHSEIERLKNEVLEQAETIFSPRTNALASNPNQENTQALFEPTSGSAPSGNRPSSGKTAGWSTRSQFTKTRDTFPVSDWDRYEFITMLGEGGMGSVFQARDRRLDRLVALKFIRGDNAQLVQRFLQEARAQSRIEHANICKVYEVGEVEDMPYIAMQFLDGQSVQTLREHMTLEQKVMLVRDVAEALHAAHRIGIIHRDIKPANILVESVEDGSLRPVLMDFGLARDTRSNDGLTQTGTIMGTPAYMSPEQAKGDSKRLDRRSDIFSLGAMFYELLTGKLPFEASSSLQILFKVIHEEPQPIRKLIPTLPLDLETITLKCLEKNPNRRYESAHALAHDLQNYLDGEPIQAQQASWRYRLAKKARKNKTVVAVSAAALIAVMVFGGIALRARLVAVDQARRAQLFGEAAEKIESMMRVTYFMPLHDTRRELAIAQEQMDAIRTQMSESTRLTAGPGNYALGRGYLALYEYEKALDHLQTARQSVFQSPGLDYALGRVLGEIYRKKMEEMERTTSKDLQKAQKEALQKEYLEPALQSLDAYRAKLGPTSRDAAYVEGLIAFYREDFTGALKNSQTAFEQVPWLYEAKKLEGDVYLALAAEKPLKEDFAGATEYYRRAGEAYDQAGELGRSDVTVFLGKAKRWERVMRLNRLLRKPLNEPLEHVLAQCDHALQANPENAEAYRLKSFAYMQLGLYQLNKGEDPRPTTDQMVGVTQQALQRNPQDAIMYGCLGEAYEMRGEYEYGQGLDPRQTLRQSVESFQTANRLNPNYSPAFNNLGITYKTLGEYEMKQGKDPRPALGLAAENFQKTIQIDPADQTTYNNLGVVYQMQGEYEMLCGIPPQAAFDNAGRNFEIAFRHNPKTSYAITNLAELYREKAAWSFEQGLSPENDLSKAETTFDQALQNFPDDDWVLGRRCLLETLAARWAIKQGHLPQPFFDRAASAAQQALRVNAKNAETYYMAAQMYRAQAEWMLAQKKNPGAAFQSGLKMVEQALAIDPQNGEAVAIRGALYWLQAKSEPSPTARAAAAGRARKALETALQMNGLLKREYEPLLTEARRMGTPPPVPLR